MKEPDRNEKIWKRLMASINPDSSANEKEEIRKMAQALSRVSSHHHYIPQHYIKGFTGEDRLLSVYDKKLDIIKTKRIGTNGVFYQKDRNTVEVDEMKISIIEDYFFSQIDNEFAGILKGMREKANDGTLLSDHNQGMLNAFIIDLFWRNPLTDPAFKDLYGRSKITFKDRNSGQDVNDKAREQRMKDDPVYEAMQRSAMNLTALNEILKQRPQGNSSSKLWEFTDELFLLGDYPMLFQHTPANQTDLVTMNFFLPISAKRMYASINCTGLNFGTKDAHLFNALIIEQSEDTVCSPNKLLLEQCVRYYKEQKKRGILLPLKQMLFSRVSD